MSIQKKIAKELKDFGYYELRIFILVSLFEIFASIGMVLPLLTHAKLDFRCSFSNHSTNGTSANKSGLLYAVKPDGILENLTMTEKTNSSLFCKNCCDKRCSEETFSTEFTSIISQWNLICDQEYVASFINTLTMVGLLCGGIVTGQLSDQFGRKRVLYACYALLIIFQLISGFVNSWQLYSVCRFFIGALITSIMLTNFILPMEYVIPKWRTFIGCIGFWPVGIMLLSISGYFIRDWRYLTIITACAGIPLLVTWWFVTESPRWLFTHGHKEAAKKIIQDMSDFNKAAPSNFMNMERFLQEEQEKELMHKKYSYWHLFSTFELGKRTLILNYGWFVCCSVYYGLLFTTGNLSGNRYINIFLSGVVELPAVFLVLAINNSFGRKRTIIMLVGLAGVSSFSMLFLLIAGKYYIYSNFVLALAMLAKFGITGGWAALQVLSAEIFPTVVRSLGVGSCSVIARIGGIAAIQIIKLNNIYKQVPFIIFGFECVSFVLLLLCIPETAGVPLEDMLNSKEKQIEIINSCNNSPVSSKIVPLNEEPKEEC